MISELENTRKESLVLKKSIPALNTDSLYKRLSNDIFLIKTSIFFFSLAFILFLAKKYNFIDRNRQDQIIPINYISPSNINSKDDRKILFEKINSLELSEIESIMKKLSMQTFFPEENKNFLDFLEKKSLFFYNICESVKKSIFITNTSEKNIKDLISDCNNEKYFIERPHLLKINLFASDKKIDFIDTIYKKFFQEKKTDSNLSLSQSPKNRNKFANDKMNICKTLNRKIIKLNNLIKNIREMNVVQGQFIKHLDEFLAANLNNQYKPNNLIRIKKMIPFYEILCEFFSSEDSQLLHIYDGFPENFQLLNHSYKKRFLIFFLLEKIQEFKLGNTKYLLSLEGKTISIDIGINKNYVEKLQNLLYNLCNNFHKILAQSRKLTPEYIRQISIRFPQKELDNMFFFIFRQNI